MSVSSTIPKLSVCIPTYNRLPQLRRLLKALLPQLTASCELVILDNCSSEAVEPGIRDLIEGFTACEIRIIRHPVNVGGNANILRCFEVARGEWVWPFGDDDLPTDQAVATVLEEAQTEPEVIFINFRSNILDLTGTSRTMTVSADGLEEFVKAWDNFSNLLFISAGLYRRTAITSKICFAYSFIDTCGPHLALLMITLIKTGGITRFSQRKTIEWALPEDGEQWDHSVVHKRLLRLLDLIPTSELRELWYQKISTESPPPIRSLLSLFKFVVSKKGQLEPVREQLEMASYLAVMLPGYRLRAPLIWLTAYSASFFWLPFYLVWLSVPSSHPQSLSRYGQEPDIMTQFLANKRG